MKKHKMTKTTSKRRKRSEKLYKKLPYGESSTLGSMTKMATISKDLWSRQLLRLVLPKKHSMIIFCKSEVERNMGLISTIR